MADANDMELVREFAGRNSEPAFAELVRRHVNLVYSVALRFTRNPDDAQDVTQAVFIILARKAGRLRERTVLTGWLYETTRFVATRLLRTNARRYAREQEAYMQSTLNEVESGEVWRSLEPHLEAAMSELGGADRALVALRFYENRSGSDAAALLGVREEAVHKRTARAVAKLRKFFLKRGVVSTTAILAGAISANSVQAAPAALAVTVAAAAFSKGAAAGTSSLALVQGALKLMALAKAKAAGIAGVILIALTTAGVMTYKLVQARDAGLPLVGVEYDIGADGIMFARATIQGFNDSTNTVGTNDFPPMQTSLDISRFTDERGRAVQFTREVGVNGVPFRYTFSLNQPVLPGRKFLLRFEGTVDGLGTGSIKPTGEPNAFEFQIQDRMGNGADVQRTDVYRLPAGAVVLAKSPADLEVRTNAGRVELQMNKRLTPPGKFDILIRYRLPAAAK